VTRLPQSDQIRIGRFRLSRQRFWKIVYRLIAVVIAFMFVAGLIYTILFGVAPV